MYMFQNTFTETTRQINLLEINMYFVNGPYLDCLGIFMPSTATNECHLQLPDGKGQQS